MQVEDNYKNEIMKLANAVLGYNVIVEHVERLGGLTNLNFKVITDVGVFVFRFPGIGTDKLISRSDEQIFVDLADKIDIDAKNVHFDPVSGIKISKYIENAVTLNTITIKTRENLDSIATLFRRLHDCKQAVPVRFDVFEKIAEYESLLAGVAYKIAWSDYKEIRQEIFRLESLYNLDNLALSFCHNDPLCENFIRGSDRMYLVDWEYAGMNDPYWDIADVIIEGEFTELDEQYFLQQYIGRIPESREFKRVLLNKILLDFLWSLWGLQRHSCGEDLLDYANTRYLRAKNNLQTLRKGYLFESESC